MHWSRCGLAVLKGRITSLCLLATLLLMHSSIPLAFFAIMAHCRLRVKLVSTSPLRSFSANLLYSEFAPKDVVAKNYFSFSLEESRNANKFASCHIKIIVFQ